VTGIDAKCELAASTNLNRDDATAFPQGTTRARVRPFLLLSLLNPAIESRRLSSGSAEAFLIDTNPTPRSASASRAALADPRTSVPPELLTAAANDGSGAANDGSGAATAPGRSRTTGPGSEPSRR
jgi:hypothetical protein